MRTKKHSWASSELKCDLLKALDGDVELLTRVLEVIRKEFMVGHEIRIKNLEKYENERMKRLNDKIAKPLPMKIDYPPKNSGCTIDYPPKNKGCFIDYDDVIDSGKGER